MVVQTEMQRIANRFKPILCVRVCVNIKTMLKFNATIDVDAKANVKCEQALTETSHFCTDSQTRTHTVVRHLTDIQNSQSVTPVLTKVRFAL